MSREADMVRRKAKTMQTTEVVAELDRIDRGLARAVGEGARKRYITRREIFSARLRELTK